MPKRHPRTAYILISFVIIALSSGHISYNQSGISKSPLSTNLSSSPRMHSVSLNNFFPPLEDFDSKLDALYQEKASNAIWLAATGDIMFHSPQVKAAYDSQTQSYDFTESFAKVMPYLSSANFTLGNFETTTAGADRGFSGYPAFNAPDETLEAIKWAGYDFLSTANNHCLDRGISGIERTIEMIESNGLAHSGTFLQSDEDRLPYVIMDVDGVSLAILSTTYGCNGFEAAYPYDQVSQAVNLTHQLDMAAVLQEIEVQDVDMTLVFIHWGNEYQRSPAENEQALAQLMIENGADIILGSHPHVIQPSEVIEYEGELKYVIYSMGNFVSNQSRATLSNANGKYTENGVIVYLQLTKDQSGTHLSAVKHIPTWVRRYDENNQAIYEILPIEKQASYEDMPAIDSYTRFAYDATMSMMVSDLSNPSHFQD